MAIPSLWVSDWGGDKERVGKSKAGVSAAALISEVGSTELRNPGQCRAGQFYKQLQKKLSHALEAHVGRHWLFLPEPSNLKESRVRSIQARSTVGVGKKKQKTKNKKKTLLHMGLLQPMPVSVPDIRHEESCCPPCTPVPYGAPDLWALRTLPSSPQHGCIHGQNSMNI
jgi:hypothetical protein